MYAMPYHTPASLGVRKGVLALFRQIDKTNAQVFTKDATKQLPRRVLGMDLRLALSGWKGKLRRCHPSRRWLTKDRGRFTRMGAESSRRVLTVHHPLRNVSAGGIARRAR